MSVFEVGTLVRAIGGRWIHRAAKVDEGHVIGVGIDSRENLTGKAFFAIKGEHHDGHDFLREAAESGAALAVVEREISSDGLPRGLSVAQVASTREALGRLAYAHRESLANTRVIAITGSSGKTTTKRLVHSALSQTMTGTCATRSFNNEIGVPLTLLAVRPTDEYVVVEVGTNAPGEIASLTALAEPDIAVITNIGRAHLEGLGGVEGIAREKASILSKLRDGGTAIINADSHLMQPYIRLIPDTILFGESETADLRLTDYGTGVSATNATHYQTKMPEQWWFEVCNRDRFMLRLPGRHNAVNAIAAIAVARRMGLTDDAINRGLLAAEPEPMRMTVEQTAGMTIVNDAYNANPDSMAASLRAFDTMCVDADRRVVILGDMLELGSQAQALHHEIGQVVASLHRERPINLLILIGEHVSAIAAEMDEMLNHEDIVHLPILDEPAIDRITARLDAGDAILLKGSRRIGLERIAARLHAADSSQVSTSSPEDATVS